MMKNIPNIKYPNSNMFFLIAGPCVVESEQVVMEIAKKCCEISEKYKIPYIFKASYKKANRSSLNSFTGIGDDKAIEILARVKKEFNIPILTDIHTAQEAEFAAQVADILQIPAFLCRQSDLLVAAAKTGKIINIKKGQFLSPEAMKFAIEKIKNTSNSPIMLTERGTTFGYNDLIVDFRAIPIMQSFGVPVIMDITHSLQKPNMLSGVTGGQPDMIETIAKAAISVGADGIFIETHPNPQNALSDGANMLKMDKLDDLIGKLCKLKTAVNSL